MTKEERERNTLHRYHIEMIKLTTERGIEVAKSEEADTYIVYSQMFNTILNHLILAEAYK